MPLNGSGSYTTPNTFLPNTTILSALVNGNFSDAATALSTAVYKDGQQTLTANIPFANFKITGLGTGSARTDSINYGQVQDGKANWVVAGGTSDAITATYAPAITALVDGQQFWFRATAANATTTPTFNPSGLGANTITKQGGAPLLLNDIAGNLAEIGLRYNLANTRYELLNPAQIAAPLITPQGRLTLTSGKPVLNSDVTAATAVFYTPYIGNQVPIYNGTLTTVQTFSEQTLTLVSNHLASTIYDVFAFLNSGTFTIGTGPAWNNSAAGAGARGAGAGTTQLAFQNGFLTNAVSMTARNGATTYTVAANQGTYLGSIFIDSVAGQITANFSYGQSRKFGPWNAHNRVAIQMKAGDNTAGWNYTGTIYRAQNNSSANSITVFCGLAEEWFILNYSQLANSPNTYTTGIGWNSTTSPSGTVANWSGILSTLLCSYFSPPSLGINTVTALEKSNGSGTSTSGTETNMCLSAQYRG